MKRQSEHKFCDNLGCAMQISIAGCLNLSYSAVGAPPYPVFDAMQFDQSTAQYNPRPVEESKASARLT